MITKIEHSEGGAAVVDRKHNLYITGRGNDGYKRLGSSRLELRARMSYKIITDGRADYGPYRVTTLGYDIPYAPPITARSSTITR